MRGDRSVQLCSSGITSLISSGDVLLEGEMRRPIVRDEGCFALWSMSLRYASGESWYEDILAEGERRILGESVVSC